ncbi:TrkA family potassium uptake protein [Helicobacter sp. MIT 14-3879]|uniref:potassium channel family protein n=1 Tax=Helicobacter sp. MIT 14-3879 TaxID=2040649 RepID=UPI000E1F1D6C|nr:potassium channel protein [Helicobacter sp. MIT 14-3879]RDU64665.1 potassium channel protein [Helicobacter sp. MIT 14-3879]
MAKSFRWFWSSDKSKKPEIDLTSELLNELSRFRFPLVVVQVFLIIGTLGYLALEDYTLIEAFFQASYTFTNTGFGALKEHKFTPITIIFTTVLMLIGAATITFCVAIVVNVIMGGKLISIIKEVKMINKIARLKNHYVIFYHNEFSLQLSRHFLKAQIPFVVIDNGEHFEKEAIENKYPYYINDDPHSINTILKSHISSAKGAVIFSKNTTDNIAIIVSIRLYQEELKRKKYNIISIANKEEEIDKLKKIGCNYVVSPTNITAQRISSIILKPGSENIIENFMSNNENSLSLEEVVVPKYSWLVLRKLKEAHLREVVRVSVVGIRQKDGQYISMPTGDVLISSECKVLLIGAANDIRQAKKILMRKQKPEELKYV